MPQSATSCSLNLKFIHGARVALAPSASPGFRRRESRAPEKLNRTRHRFEKSLRFEAAVLATLPSHLLHVCAQEGKALAQKALPFPLALYTFSHSSSLSRTRSVQHALEAVSSCLSDVVQEQELQSLCEVGNAAPRWHEKLKTPTNSKKHVNMSALTLISICGGACKLSQRTGTAVARSAAVV